MRHFKSIILLLAFLFVTCDENPFHPKKESNPVGNQPPETYLFLFLGEDSTGQDSLNSSGIATTPSKQIIHWWGEDKDGQVIGYYYQWDYEEEKTWTTSEYDTFYVPIRTAYDEFAFSVWAVDNDSLIDPTPAVQVFPVYNSSPDVNFKNRSNPPAPGGNPNVTTYTFPTRTFMWDAADPDGQETITKILYALDDTTTWIELPGIQRDITLTEIPPGEHRFFLKAQDVAGANSNIISFPDPLDEETPNTWVVKEPIGDVLLVNDYALDQNTFEVQSFYENLLDNIVGADGYSTWEIGSSRTPAINPQNRLPYATADIKANLNYFKKIIWFAHYGSPSLSEAGLSLTQYIADGGLVFITNGNSEVPDTTWGFTSIDSVYVLNPNGRLFTGTEVIASFTGTESDTLLNLTLEKLLANRVSALVPGSGTEIVYQMIEDSLAAVEVPYSGSPPVGLRYQVGLGKSIYFSLPLHFLDGKGNVEEVLRYILEEELIP